MPTYKNKDTKKTVKVYVPKKADGTVDKRYAAGRKLYLKKDGTVDCRYNHCIDAKDRPNLRKLVIKPHKTLTKKGKACKYQARKVSTPVKKTKSNWGFPKTKNGKRDLRYTEKCWLKADGTPDYRRF